MKVLSRCDFKSISGKTSFNKAYMNYTALSQTPTKEQLVLFEQKYPLPLSMLRGRAILKVILIIVAAWFFIGGTQTLITTLIAQHGDILSPFISYLFTAFILLFIWVIGASAKKQQIDSTKISLFAEQNGLDFVRSFENPGYSGIYFGIGHSRRLTNVIVSRNSKVKFEIGNYTYTTGSGKNQRTYNNGYIRMGMSRNLPQIVLDASSNNMRFFGKNISNLPTSFDTSQKMSLEGDFDKYFTLYAPKEYERDALYIFTPDLMALMIDNTRAYDSEIIDNQLFIYNSGIPFILTNAAQLERIFSIIELVGGKTDSQTDNYADEKIGDRNRDEVAAGGQRLRKNVSVFVVIVVVISILAIFVPFILGLVGATH